MRADSGSRSRISPPADEKDIQRFLADVESHPDYVEIERRLKELTNDCPNGDVRYWSVYRHSRKGKWERSRATLHKSFVAKALAGHRKASRGTKPVAVLLMGTPGSGKTSVGMKYTGRFHVNFVVINADDIKEALPEYRGWNAAALHEESSYVAEELTFFKAAVDGHHIVFDLTGTNETKMVGLADNLEAMGYEIHLILVKIPAWLAASRAWERFCKVALEKDPDAKSGRFVPPEYVYNVVGDKPSKTYNTLKKHPAVKSWLCVSTEKSPAHILEEGSR